MTSEGPLIPAWVLPAVTATAAVGSAAGGLVSAFNQPKAEKAPSESKSVAEAQNRARMRVAAATDRRSTILTKQPLGTVGTG